MLSTCARYRRHQNIYESLKNSSEPGSDVQDFLSENLTAFTFDDAPLERHYIQNIALHARYIIQHTDLPKASMCEVLRHLCVASGAGGSWLRERGGGWRMGSWWDRGSGMQAGKMDVRTDVRV
jgi:hypothetical protein